MFPYLKILTSSWQSLGEMIAVLRNEKKKKKLFYLSKWKNSKLFTLIITLLTNSFLSDLIFLT